MRMMTARYEIDDVDEPTSEEFINELFAGLKKYEKEHPDFKFKMTFDMDYVEVKTLKMDESAN